MKDIEIVVFNDKSWVRFTEYQKLDEENEQLKAQIKKMKCCQNCVNETKNELEEPCWSCHKRSQWRLKIGR